MRRHELSDAEWEFVRPLLPESSRGRKRLDDRRVLNGIVWKFRTGTAWRDVPDRYGPWATLHTRFRRWAADGTFDRMLRAVQAKADAAGDIEWLVSVDSTIVRAHQHAAGARKGGRDPALGRSRGGLTSKIHLACDGRGRPLAFVVTGGNSNDCTRFTTVMDAIRVPRIGPGRPRTRPDHVLGDKGYSSRAIRAWLRRRGIPHTIPERADQAGNRARRGRRGGRPPTFDREVYKHRNVVERCFNRLKQWRGIATRYDKTVQSYEAAVTLASLLMWA
ncbi:IS5 family transposase [Streptomyces sp. ADI92-24]|uniref:IS5 family transposase n=1 Tax=Streptomyces sp. ADI92-24 TaxID=1522756 RepID=UPI001F151FB0|nr:IS5 family transposase [Streptomyces sp. ADI92-24]